MKKNKKFKGHFKEEKELMSYIIIVTIMVLSSGLEMGFFFGYSWL